MIYIKKNHLATICISTKVKRKMKKKCFEKHFHHISGLSYDYILKTHWLATNQTKADLVTASV